MQNIQKGSIWAMYDTIGNKLAEETVMSVDHSNKKLKLKSRPVDDIDFEDFVEDYRYTGKTENSDISADLKGMLGGFGHLRSKPIEKKDDPNTKSVPDSKPKTSLFNETPKPTVQPKKVDVNIDPKIKSILDLTLDSLRDYNEKEGVRTPNIAKTIGLVDMFEVDLEEFVEALVEYPDTEDIIKTIVLAFFKIAR